MGGLVYDYSGNHGRGDSFEHTITSLEPNTRYKLSVSADNGYGDPAFSLDYVEFTTDCKLSITRDVTAHTKG